MPSTVAPPAASKGIFKRFLVGRRVSSAHMEHTLLPKVLALPIFSSDALSSVAYATEEIIGVLLIASTQIYGLVVPISLAIAALLVIVVISYRQIIRAYPSGGGAYIVSKENLGVGAGLVAAASLLTDYILTVSVSVTAGVLAITSAFNGLFPYRVEIALGLIVFVTIMNIRGVKEAGVLFAVPTYAFIVLIYVTVAGGLYKCFLGGGCPQSPHVVPIPGLAPAAGGVALFVVLKAFASGSTALTGVEAISNGVQVFRRPQARNASTTLAAMGAIAVTMFVGISYLAAQAHAVKSDEMTVVAQIAQGVFGRGVMFYLVQGFTAAILILAANTAYQGFPQLSSILARDRFMPRQFMNRGDRLVFSNGIIGLAFVAGFLIWVFDANIESLIHLYVLGVFTSFTLAQAGMIRHWLHEGKKGDLADKGWRRSIVVNSIGAVATGAVTLVVAVTKFAPEGFPRPGAWMVIIAILLQIALFKAIHTHYEKLRVELRRGVVKATGHVATNRVLLVVRDFDVALSEALGYIRSFHPPEFRAVWIGDGLPPAEIQRRWQEVCASGGPELEILERRGSVVRTLREYVRGIPRERPDFVTVVVPEVVRERLSLYFLTHVSTIRLKAGLLREPNVVMADVPVPVSVEDVDGKALIPNRVEALLFISAVNDATIRAVNYARTLHAADVRAIHIALDPEGTGDIVDEWAATGSPIPLEVAEAPFRDLTGPMLAAVRQVTKRPDTIAAVIVPQYIVKKRYRLLHNQSALFVKRLFLSEPRAVLTSVPWTIEG